MIQQPIQSAHWLLLFAVGAVLPALTTLAALILCRFWQSDRSLVIAIPMQVLVCSFTAGLPLYFPSLRPVTPVILGACSIAVVGEVIILIVGLKRPHWEEPRGFDVESTRGKSSRP